MTATRSIITIAVDTSAAQTDAQIKELIRRIPGTHLVDSAVFEAQINDFEWGTEDLPTLPMGQQHARALIDDEGFTTAIIAIDQQDYLDAQIYSQTEGADTHEDIVHRQVFSFGLPHECTTRIIAVQGDDFIISYTTKITEFLD